MTVLDHKHLIIKGNINRPPSNTRDIDEWMCQLIEAIDMEIMMGPYSAYSKMEGNRGITSVAIITTSHIVMHIWDEDVPGSFQMDLYSCKDFDIDIVLKMLYRFETSNLDYFFIDRNDKLKHIGV